MDGINGTIFAYGVTSSGKTHTMMVSMHSCVMHTRAGHWHSAEWIHFVSDASKYAVQNLSYTTEERYICLRCNTQRSISLL